MHCYNINLDIKPLKFDLDLRNQVRSHGYYSLDDINPVLVEFLAERQLKVIWVEVFHKHPWDNGNIHVDGSGGDFVKLNWVYGGSDSWMCWYQPLSQHKQAIEYDNRSPHISYRPDEVELVHRHALQGVCIIQAGVPHNVIMGSEYRHALSMVLADPGGKKLSYSQSRLRFSDCVK